MSNTNIMNSNISINVDENGKSVIRVTELTSRSLVVDPRDNLIQLFREALKSTSATFTLSCIEYPNEEVKQYDITPVADELEYFKQRVLLLSPFGDFPEGENYKTICKFFDDLRTVSLGPHNPEALEKFNQWTPKGLNGLG